MIRRSAFTLVELVITMLVMGILTAVAAPRYFEAINRFRVEAAAKRVAADLNLARKCAMTKGGVAQGEWVSFYAANDNYKLHNDPDLDRPGDEYWVHLQETAYSVDLISVTFTNEDGATDNQTIKFDMYGCAKSGSPAKRVVTGQIVVGSGPVQRTIFINKATGEANIL